MYGTPYAMILHIKLISPPPRPVWWGHIPLFRIVGRDGEAIMYGTVSTYCTVLLNLVTYI